MPISELTQHQEFVDLVKKAVREAVREELHVHVLQQELTKLSNHVELNVDEMRIRFHVE